MSASESKAWWQSRTILGIVTLLGVFLLERFNAGVTQDEVGNIVTLAAGLIGAVLAIFGRIKAVKKITVAGGEYNPNAEVRKAQPVDESGSRFRYKNPKTGGYTLPAALAGIIWLVALAGIIAAIGTCKSSQEIDFREMMERRDAALEAQVLPPITWSEFVDRRGFLVRLMDSVKVTLTFGKGSYATHGAYRTYFPDQVYVTGGAEY